MRHVYQLLFIKVFEIPYLSLPIPGERRDLGTRYYIPRMYGPKPEQEALPPVLPKT